MNTYLKCLLTFSSMIGIGSLLGYGTVAWKKPQAKSMRKPHIILIVADDMGWNDVSFHGADQIPTPNIDALAYNGVILNRHYVLPICTPSRTTLMTGRYAIRDGMQGFPLQAGERRSIPLNVTLMPEHMRQLGYETRLVGKWHLGYYAEAYTPARRGFDSFFGYYNGYIDYFNKTISQTLDDGSVRAGKDLHRDGPSSLSIEPIDSRYFTDLITGEAERIIKSNGNEKPLFLQVAHLAVHASDSPLETLQVRNATVVNETFAHIKDSKRRKYAGMMMAMDESVGRITKALSEARMLDNSIVVFMADNGAPTIDMYENAGSNYPLRGIKDTLFEGAVRGAACVFSPLIKAPSRLSEQLFHIADWLPTLYSAAGGQVGDLGEIDGMDQWEALTQASFAPARHNVLVNIDEMRNWEAAIIGRHKLVKGAINLGEGYYGETGSDSSYPAYDVENALSSTTGQVIRRLQGFVSPSAKKARKLRQLATVHCEPVSRYANCSGTCLFDIVNDPCESQDLSERRPKVVKALESLIDSYRSVLMQQRNSTGTRHPIDACSFPKYFNGTWMPWLKSDLSTIIPSSTMNYNRLGFQNVRRARTFPMFIVLLITFVSFNSYAIWCKLQVPSARKPHIIIIVADDMGWNDVSFHGANQIPTPNIDALAYNGVILNRHYVLPTCTPSRSSLMTGRYAIRDGMQGTPLSPGQPKGLPLNVTLMPEYMRQLGYETRLVGKWHLGYYTESHTPARRGFDSFYGYYNGHITYFNKTIAVRAEDHLHVGYDLHRDNHQRLCVEYGNDEYFTDLITEEAVKIIQVNRNEKPLYLEIAHLATHSNGIKDNPLEVRNSKEVNETFAYIKDNDRRTYAGVMKALDESVGKVVKALSEARMLENSIVLFMSDNGAPTKYLYENFGSNYPLRGIKNTTFEGGVRGAACIFSPLIKKSSRLWEEYVHVTDWLPTFYSAADGQVADLGEIDGYDQWDSLVNGVVSPRHNVLINIDETHKVEAAIVGRYKLVKGADPSTERYYGATGNDPLYPEYTVEEALTSPAGLAIGRLSEFTSVTAEQARKLRDSAVVNCRREAVPKTCSEACLFDIISDPCETQDLSSNYSLVNVFMLQLLQMLIEKYRAVLAPQGVAHIDDCAFPQYFNGSWMPWRKDDAALTSASRWITSLSVQGLQGVPVDNAHPRGVPLNVTLMPQYLRDLGYETRLLGKWDLGYYTKNHTPVRRGFDSFVGCYNGLISYFTNTTSQQVQDELEVIGYNLHRDDSHGMKVELNNSKYFTDLITDEAVRIIKSNADKRQLFLEIAHFAPHAAFSTDDPQQVRDPTENDRAFAYIEDKKCRRHAGTVHANQTFRQFTRQFAIDRSTIAGVMRALDESVGRVVEALCDAGMLDNSIVVFMSDNGAATVGPSNNAGSNYPLRGIKDTLFEGAVRSATFVFSPLIKRSRKLSEEYVHVTDWLPTLYSAAGGNVSDLGSDIDGFDQWRSLTEDLASPRRNLLLNIDELRAEEAAIVGRLKIIKPVDKSIDGYFGHSCNSPSYPSYNLTEAFNSAAGLAIARLPGFVNSTEDEARALRASAVVTCRHSANYSKCSDTCLFDIVSDPCETRDLSKQRPNDVVALKMFIDSYRKVLVPQTLPTAEPCSYSGPKQYGQQERFR
ncbi:uncharacterized protein LOC131671204 [Phymastichus coffea]|uniref:uncharacterized protein LOC131671204 n=1 Tax=Phymastichus coffea TaxID=108790 RepID=UPI00273BA92B|nr:uncharacterized protein LOC131671204 [Phymastichus coffea]